MIDQELHARVTELEPREHPHRALGRQLVEAATRVVLTDPALAVALVNSYTALVAIDGRARVA